MPSAYTEKTAIEMARLVAEGKTIEEISRTPGMPTIKTVTKWITENKYGAFNSTPKTVNATDGRPSIYSEALSQEILNLIMEGNSLSTIAKLDGMPTKRTILLWVFHDKEGFKEKYQDAMLIKVYGLVDEIIDISDDSRNDFMEKQNRDGSTFVQLNPENIGRARLRIDSRKWLASKSMPNEYGDKQILDHQSSDNSMTPTMIERVIVDPKTIDTKK